jgi:hypothetical protein
MEEKLLSLATEQKALLLVVGFLLTTLLGGTIGFVFNIRLWKTQTEHVIYRASFDEGVKFLDESSGLIGRRLFLLQRFLWAIQDGVSDKIKEAELEYFMVVKEWNYNSWRSRNKIRLLISEEYANEFLDYRDDNAGDDPHSMHYLFVVAHRRVMASVADPSESHQARLATEHLNWACSKLLERLTTEFLKKAAALQLLQVPFAPGGAELAAQRHATMANPSMHNS